MNEYEDTTEMFQAVQAAKRKRMELSNKHMELVNENLRLKAEIKRLKTKSKERMEF